MTYSNILNPFTGKLQKVTDPSGGGVPYTGATDDLDLGAHTITASAATLTSITSKLLKTDSSGNVVAAVAGTDYQVPLVYQKGSASYTVSTANGVAVNVTFPQAFSGTPNVVGTLVYGVTFGLSYQYYMPSHYIRSISSSGFTFVVMTGNNSYGTTGSLQWLAWL